MPAPIGAGFLGNGSYNPFFDNNGVPAFPSFVYNVQLSPYNATGLGLVDDIAAIQAACDACEAAGGGIVFMPFGIYLISTSIQLGDNTYLCGDTRFTTIITCTPGFQGAQVKFGVPGPSVAMIVNKDIANASAVPVQHSLKVSDLQLNGRADVINAFGLANAGAAIFFRQVENVEIERVEVFNCSNTGFQVDGWNSSTNWPVNFNLNVRIKECRLNLTYNPTGNQPIYQPDGSGGFVVPIVILMRGANNVIIEDNVINDLAQDTGSTHTNDAMDIVGCSYFHCVNNRIFDCGDGIGFNTGNYAVIAHNIIARANGVGVAMYASDGPVGAGTGQLYVLVDGNIITDLGTNVAHSQQPGKNGILINSPGTPSPNVSTDINVVNNIITYAPGAFGPSAMQIGCSQAIVANNLMDCGLAPNVIVGLRVNTGQGGGNHLDIHHNTVRNGFAGTIGFQISINLSNACTDTFFKDNRTVGITTPWNPAALANMPGCVVRGNSWNPIGPQTPPSVPSSGTPLLNPFPYDCWVYITAGTGATVQPQLNGANIGPAIVSTTTGPVFIPANQTITLTYTGGTVTWLWFAY